MLGHFLIHHTFDTNNGYAPRSDAKAPLKSELSGGKDKLYCNFSHVNVKYVFKNEVFLHLGSVRPSIRDS